MLDALTIVLPYFNTCLKHGRPIAVKLMKSHLTGPTYIGIHKSSHNTEQMINSYNYQ
jgi:hypothetical protein